MIVVIHEIFANKYDMYRQWYTMLGIMNLTPLTHEIFFIILYLIFFLCNNLS